MARKDNKRRNLKTGESYRVSDGLYMYRYTDAMTGKRQTVYAKDLPELRAKEKQIEKDIADNILTDSAVKKLTVNKLVDRYLKTRELADTTRVNYVKMWNNRAKDEIGNIKVIQLRTSHVKGFYAKMSRSGYSHSTIKMIHTMLYPALEMAVDDNIIRKNPSKNCLVSDYGVSVKEKEILTLEQQKKLLDFVADSNIYGQYIWMLQIFLEVGLRCGELLGLTISDVDMLNREIVINHQLIYKNLGDGCRFHISSTKTDAGIRVIPMNNIVYNAFEQQFRINKILDKSCNIEVDGYTDFVFLAKTGRPLMPSAVNNVLYNIIDAYNVEEVEKARKECRKAELLNKISVHSLRHTACTNMALQGINIKVLQYIMGHASCDISLDTYSHITNQSIVKDEIQKYDSAIANENTIFKKMV